MVSKNNLNWKISTQALHAGENMHFSDSHTTPIFATSTFIFPDADTGRKRFTGEESGYIYTRLGNPTIDVEERKLAILEGSSLLKQNIPVEGHAFATGMGCISTTLMALTKTDGEIIATNPLYGGTNYLLDGILKSYQINTTLVDTAGENGIESVQEKISSKTNVIYLESPANPNLVICDIEAISKLGKENNVPVVVDNTFGTPILQKPLEMGAVVSLHSTTKYLNGHGTTVSGILATTLTGNDLDRLKFIKKNLGATQSPFDAFLVINGIKTLPLRMERHCTNAQAVAEYLEEHPKIEAVHYPGLTSHPQYKLAQKQMKGGFGGMIACELKGGIGAGVQLMNKIEIFTLAVSLGCVDSLIQHPASMTHAKVPRDIRLKGGITDGLVRLSIGIEDIDDLIEALSTALSQI